MRKRIILVFLIVLATFVSLVSSISGSSQSSYILSLQSPVPPEVGQIQSDTVGDLEITWDAQTGKPSFIRGHIPISVMGLTEAENTETAAYAFVNRYSNLLGVSNSIQELIVAQTKTDELGISHVTLNQVYQGVEVYGAYIRVHLNGDSQEFVAASSSFIPNIALLNVNAEISSSHALATAQMAMPQGILLADPQLVIYPEFNKGLDTVPRLIWIVDLRDGAIPARNLYFIDASDGNILDVIEDLHTDRNRETYDAENGYDLPGTLVRSEGDPSTGDQDVDDAHNFAGDTYDYYFNTHNRDSYDDAGASLISTANYGVAFTNAFWDGSQMVYGDGFAVNDVVAHELTHAVTEHSANLEYRWQSGALNESFSDMFGAMVDRNDWLMGEDLPAGALGGQEAIRDLADPPRFGQPDHTDDWVATCSDNEGVHTNSGITNKAYYNIATAIGKDKAELIFYRTLVVYLSSNSSLEDTRSAAIQSAQDLYGTGSSEETAVNDGFNDVGLDGSFDPSANDCTCAATTALADKAVYANRMTALQVATTLYRLRDEFSSTEAGKYYRELYEQYTGRISKLLLANSDLRTTGGLILQTVSPGLTALMDGQGNNEIVTQEMVDDTVTFLEDLAAEDRASGDGELADTIEREMSHIDWDHLVGMTFDEAFEYINTQIGTSFLYLPTIMR